jgi:DNA-binding protein HU-beta
MIFIRICFFIRKIQFKFELYLKNINFIHFSFILNFYTVTKAEVISEIAEKTGVDKADVSSIVEGFVSVIKDSMIEGNNVYVRGFGSFVNKKRARKVARNISKNTAIIIEEHYIPSFKPAKVFVNKIKTSKKVKGKAE